MKKNTLVINLMLAWLVMGCTEPGKTPVQAQNELRKQSSLLPGEDQVLATVNGSPITRYELEQAIRKTLGESVGRKLDASGKQTVLESLVASRAIAQLQEQTAVEKDVAAIEKKTAAYREELLVERYLAENAPARPVTDQMARAYYQEHPEQFGARTVRTFEMVTSIRGLSAGERDDLIPALGGVGSNKDWQTWVAKMKGKGYPLQYRTDHVTESALQPRLIEMTRALEIGEASPFTFIDERPYLLRITSEKAHPPQPYKAVKARIHKMLAPVQLKETVKAAAARVIEKSDVVYF
jgi:hypothetical protein